MCALAWRAYLVREGFKPLVHILWCTCVMANCTRSVCLYSLLLITPCVLGEQSAVTYLPLSVSRI